MQINDFGLPLGGIYQFRINSTGQDTERNACLDVLGFAPIQRKRKLSFDLRRGRNRAVPRPFINVKETGALRCPDGAAVEPDVCGDGGAEHRVGPPRMSIYGVPIMVR